jgi:hypothetical protein
VRTPRDDRFRGTDCPVWKMRQIEFALSRCGRCVLRSACNTCYERLDTPDLQRESVLMPAISSTMSARSRAATLKRSFTP